MPRRSARTSRTSASSAPAASATRCRAWSTRSRAVWGSTTRGTWSSSAPACSAPRWRATAGSREQGFRLVGMFDSSATVIGARFGSGEDSRVRSVHELDDFCRKERVDIAMVTVPAGEAETTVAAPRGRRRAGDPELRPDQGPRPRGRARPSGRPLQRADVAVLLPGRGAGLTMDLAAGVAAALAAAGEAFGPAPAVAPDLRWGALYAGARRRRGRGVRHRHRAHLRGLPAALPREPRAGARGRRPGDPAARRGLLLRARPARHRRAR